MSFVHQVSNVLAVTSVFPAPEEVYSASLWDSTSQPFHAIAMC